METNIMLSSCKLLRHKFLHILPFEILLMGKTSFCRFGLSKRKFEIEDYVISERICDDYLSLNFGGLERESGFIVGYCWNYDEWLKESFKCG
jgi:hypothetical protein